MSTPNTSAAVQSRVVRRPGHREVTASASTRRGLSPGCLVEWPMRNETSPVVAGAPISRPTVRRRRPGVPSRASRSMRSVIWFMWWKPRPAAVRRGAAGSSRPPVDLGGPVGDVVDGDDAVGGGGRGVHVAGRRDPERVALGAGLRGQHLRHEQREAGEALAVEGEAVAVLVDVRAVVAEPGERLLRTARRRRRWPRWPRRRARRAGARHPAPRSR